MSKTILLQTYKNKRKRSCLFHDHPPWSHILSWSFTPLWSFHRFFFLPFWKIKKHQQFSPSYQALSTDGLAHPTAASHFHSGLGTPWESQEGVGKEFHREEGCPDCAPELVAFTALLQISSRKWMDGTKITTTWGLSKPEFVNRLSCEAAVEWKVCRCLVFFTCPCHYNFTFVCYVRLTRNPSPNLNQVATFVILETHYLIGL